MPDQLEFQIFKDPDNEGSPLAPGVFIKRELEKRSWPQSALAEILGKPLAAVNEVIKGKRAITPEMAVALGTAFSHPPALWMHREAAYRMSLIERSSDNETAKKAQLFGVAPIKDLQRRGWLNPEAQSASELEKELTKFLGYNPIHDDGRLFSAVARKSLSTTDFSNAQSAWLYQAARIARKINVLEYNPTQLDNALGNLKRLVKAPEDAARIPIILAESGIRFVVVEDLPRTRIDGAAFFLDDDKSKPVIALSLRWDRMESVWHTLIHEMRHIANEDPFSLDLDLDGNDKALHLSEIEKRANRESAAWFIDPEQLRRFILRAAPTFSKDSIVPFAGRMGIHPSLLVGQLQHAGVLGWDRYSDLRPKIRDHILVTATCDGYGKKIKDI